MRKNGVMEPRLFLSQSVHLLAALAIGWLVLASYRWIRRRSEALGAVFAFGILARVGIGLALFWISYLDLPIARSLQTGGGFWHGAADARGYYELAAAAIDPGTPIDPLVPSPFFVRLLAVWMSIVGVSPASALFLNVCLYVVLVLAIVGCFSLANQWRLDLPCIVGVAAYSFSPVNVIHGTQPLKDALFCTLTAVACLGVLGLRGLIYGVSPRATPRAFAAGLGALAAATFGIAGIRWYDALILLASLAMMLAIFAVRGRTTRLPSYLIKSAATLMIVWLAFWAGAGPYSGVLGRYVEDGPAQFAGMIELARTGFLMSGGGTNIVIALRDDAAEGQAHVARLARRQRDTAYQREPPPKESRGRPAAPPSNLEEIRTVQNSAARAIPIYLAEQVKVVAIGLATIVVPISLLRAFSVMDITGGRGLLAVVDLDTMFQDAAIVLVLGMLWRRRGTIGDRLPLVVFGVIFSVTTAVLLGYVVTNFGTLWRLRLLVAAPLWVLVVALSPRVGRRES